MLGVLQEAVGWAWAYVQHVVVMFYWVWIPGLLGAAILSAGYRSHLRQITLKRQPSAARLWAAASWGMLSGLGRRGSIETAESLRGQGVPERLVLAYLVGSHNLGLFVVLLFTILIGLEFGLGLFLGGLAMIGFLRLFAPVRGPEQSGQGSSAAGGRLNLEDGSVSPSWRTLLGSREGWRAILLEVARPPRHLAGSSLGGLILGALILAMDNHGYWFFPNWMGDEGLGPALAAAFLAPLLSVVLFLAPAGNLFVGSSIWKTWTLAYPGVLSFVLMSLLNPLTIRALLRRPGRRRGWLLVLASYFGAALSGLAVAGLFALLGLEVTHVPWFRGLVDRVIMALPFTMLGAPGGGIKGM